MDNYDIQESSDTSSSGVNIITTGIVLIGAMLMATSPATTSFRPSISLTGDSRVEIVESSKTYGQYANPFTGEYNSSRLGLEETVMAFYQQLLEKQEPLGKEFEQVLYENIWDLLVET
jgi:hypothetical protein